MGKDILLFQRIAYFLLQTRLFCLKNRTAKLFKKLPGAHEILNYF